MIEPLRGIFCAILRNNGSDAITGLTATDIDGVIDRFTEQSRLGRIMSPEEYLKASFLKAGRAAKINTLLTAETHNDKPSYDIDEYVRMSIERLHREE